MKCLTDAQQHGRRMRAQGRNYRGGYTRAEIRAGEHKKQTCRVRGCMNRQVDSRCSAHRDTADEIKDESDGERDSAEPVSLGAIFENWPSESESEADR